MTRNLNGTKQVVVSVRFDTDMFELIQSFASVVSSTPNAVIRDAVSAYLTNQVNTPQFQEASQVHVERARTAVESLYALSHANGGPERNSLPYAAPDHALESNDTFNQQTAIG
ncbi:hypothetical protein ACFYW8_23230 [Streptomyces sp. NPDC002742]|uniref:hypothetical protein n=1 Tax=Streptomyces sp. NPDC002742 TaxID=3364663 RepID=UPI0036BC0B24